MAAPLIKLPASGPSVPNIDKFKSEVAAGNYGTVKSPGVRKKNIPSKVAKEMVPKAGKSGAVVPDSVPELPAPGIVFSAIG